MKAFIIALIATVVIAVGGNQILEVINVSSAKAGTSAENVRLSD